MAEEKNSYFKISLFILFNSSFFNNRTFLRDSVVKYYIILFLIYVFQNKKFDVFFNKFFIFLCFYIYLIFNSFFQIKFESIKFL